MVFKQMIQKMRGAGCEIKDIRAKIVGGAKFFQTKSKRWRNSGHGSIGAENVRVAREVLKKYGIPVIGLDVGGDYCRKIQFCSHTGKLIVETTKNGSKEL